MKARQLLSSWGNFVFKDYRHCGLRDILPLMKPISGFSFLGAKYINPWTYIHIHTATVVQGGVHDPTPPPPESFWYVAVFRNDFTFSGKPLIFSTIRGILYGWLARLGASDVTNNGRHLGFFQELETRLKRREKVIFWCLRWIIT